MRRTLPSLAVMASLLIGPTQALGVATIAVSGAPIVGTTAIFSVSGQTSGSGVWDAYIYPNVVSGCSPTLHEAQSNPQPGQWTLNQPSGVEGGPFTSGFQRLFFQQEAILVCAYSEDFADNSSAVAGLRVSVAPAPPNTTCNPTTKTCTSTTVTTTATTNEGVTTTKIVTCIKEYGEYSGSSQCSTRTTESRAVEPQTVTHTPRSVVAHRATKAQLRAMTSAANAHHADGFNVRQQYLRNGRVTNNGWADAEQRFRRPSNVGQTQAGVFIVFRVLGRRWHVVTYGSDVCGGHHGVPSAVCRALKL